MATMLRFWGNGPATGATGEKTAAAMYGVRGAADRRLTGSISTRGRL
jgi:hypothetical protein